MLWGSSVAARLGAPKSEELAHRVFGLVDERFVDPESLLARHNLSRHRSRVVSFGGTVYFLRSVYEYGDPVGSHAPGAAVRERRQGDAEAPGPAGRVALDDLVRSGIPLDFYPVFGVHQDSMAMLFLLPALDEGAGGRRGAIARSLAWSRGENELGEPMYGRDRFFAYRSIRRDQALFRERRYARSLARAFLDRPGQLAAGRGLAVNRECRLLPPGLDPLRLGRGGPISLAWRAR